MSQQGEVLRTLINFVKFQEELITNPNIHLNVGETLKDCFYYSIDMNDQTVDLKKVLEIDSVLDFLHDELNTGHWSDVPTYIRTCFTSASFIKCLILLKCSETFSVELLQKCLKCIDRGLLLGAPLKENSELLTASASYLSKEINKLLRKNHDSKISGEVHPTKRKITDCHRSEFEKINGKEIDVVECPSLEYFNKTYFIPQMPAILKGCMDHWPATKKWLDTSYLLGIAGDRTVPIEIGSHYADENWTQKLMTLKEFIMKFYLGEGDTLGYLAQHNLFDQITELREDIHVPEYCCLSLDYDNAIEPDINAWFGPKGTVSPLHHDPKNNILAQVFGTKQLLLFSPQDTPYLYPHEDKLLCNTSQVDPVNPDLDEYPEFSKTTMYKCLLEPGDMLFMPVKWWHHVTALDKSFSVSFWWQ